MNDRTNSIHLQFQPNQGRGVSATGSVVTESISIMSETSFNPSISLLASLSSIELEIVYILLNLSGRKTINT